MRKTLICCGLVCTLLLPLSVGRLNAQSESPAFTWGSVVMGGGGFVSAVIASKTERNVIYARTDVGGAYRWNEAGKSWVSILDWVGPDDVGLWGVDALALDPSNPSRVYMLAGTSYWSNGKTMILRSDDYGETFDTINVTARFKTDGNGMGRQNGERLAVDPNNPDILFCGTRNDGLWKSADRGASWSKATGAPTLANDLGISLVLFDPNKKTGNTTSRIYIGLSRDTDNFYVSDDAGVTWNAIAFPSTLSKKVMPQRAVLTPGGRFLYVATAVYAGPHGNGASRGALLRYDTVNKTFANISPENVLDDPPGDGGWGAYLGGIGGVSIGSGADTNFIVASTVNAWKPQIWNGSGKAAWGDKIFASADGGQTWAAVFGNISDDDAGKTTGSEQIAVLDKNGYNWIEGESIHWAGSIEIDPFNPKRVFVTSGNGVYTADDFTIGKRFSFKFTVRGIEETVPLDVASIPGGPLISVIMDYDGFVHDDITKPVKGNRHNPNIGNTYSVDYAKLKPNIVVRVGGDDKKADNNDYRFPLYYSEDTARTWKKFGTHPEPGQNYGGKIAISSDGRVVLWAPREKSTLYRTRDWGATWTQSNGSGISNTPFPKADPVDPAVFYAFGNGVWRSNDTGKTFTKTGGNFSWTNEMAVTPGVKGHVWVTGYAWDGINGGFLARSTDGGTTFRNVDPADAPQYTQRVQHSEAVGFGKAAPGQTYPAIYIYGTVGGVKGIWQSVDEAKSWVRIDDPKHAFGDLANGKFLRGDMNTFGVVYKSTAGRGIAARMPAEWIDGNGGNTRTVRQSTVKRRYSPDVKLRGQTLSLTPSSGNPLNVVIYDLKGRTAFNKTYRSAATLNYRTLVSSKGVYVVTVRNAVNKDVVFNGKIYYTKSH